MDSIFLALLINLFMGVNETKGAWNYGNMQSVNGVPLVVGDSLYIYSSGRSSMENGGMQVLAREWLR